MDDDRLRSRVDPASAAFRANAAAQGALADELRSRLQLAPADS